MLFDHILNNSSAENVLYLILLRKANKIIKVTLSVSNTAKMLLNKQFLLIIVNLLLLVKRIF